MIYSLTKDPNIILKTQEITSEIHLDKLETEIKNLETQINDRPKLKTKPDQETLDHYNMEIMNDPTFEEELKEKKELLTTLKGL